LAPYFGGVPYLELNSINCKMDSVSIDIVRGLLVIGKTHEEISSELKHLYPHITRGPSARNMRRYVAQNGLKDLAIKEG
jgi:uncharacterized protein with HEPN domain